MSKLLIGIDPGVKTGLAIWNMHTKKLDLLATVSVIRAMCYIRQYKRLEYDVEIWFEDARQRNWFGKKEEKRCRVPDQSKGIVKSGKNSANITESLLKWSRPKTIKQRLIAKPLQR